MTRQPIPTTPTQGRVFYLRAQIECCQFFLFTVEGSKCDKVDPVALTREYVEYLQELHDITNGKNLKTPNLF